MLDPAEGAVKLWGGWTGVLEIVKVATGVEVLDLMRIYSVFVLYFQAPDTLQALLGCRDPFRCGSQGATEGAGASASLELGGGH